MIGHDPLCPFTEPNDGKSQRHCRCNLIARVRADERDSFINELVADDAASDVLARCRRDHGERIAQRLDHEASQPIIGDADWYTGVRFAARIAREVGNG